MSRFKSARISEFCATGSGGTPSRSKMERYYEGGTIPWVKSGELREAVITRTSEYVTETALKESSIKLVPAGSILLAMYGATVGRLGILGIEATTNQAVCHIVPDPKVAETRYIFHAISHQVPSLIAKGVGGAQPNINQAIIKDIAIPLPPLPEQRRIAAILDQADALRVKRRDALAQLDSLTQSIFIEMFGEYRIGKIKWPVEPFESITKDTKIGLVRNAEIFGPGFDVPYIRMNAIGRSGELSLASVMRTDVTEAEREEYKLEPGDFLFNTRNSRELVGKSAVFRDKGLFVYNNNLMRVRFRSDIESDYIAATFLTPFIQNELEVRKAGTTSVFAIYYRELRSLPIPIPPTSLQREFSHRVETIQKLKDTHNASLVELDALFASLQHRAFRGEL